MVMTSGTSDSYFIFASSLTFAFSKCLNTLKLLFVIVLQGRHLVFWNNCLGACPWPCSFLEVSSNEGTWIEEFVQFIHIHH